MTHDIALPLRKVLFALVGASVAITLGGCHLSQYPDPNVAEPGEIVPASVLRRNFESMHWMLERRIAKGELTRAQKDEFVRQYADKTLAGISIGSVPPSEAWAYADVMRQANRWEDTYSLLKLAIAHDKTEDRRINDTLQLARVEAHLKRVEDGIRDARLTFKSAPTDKAPILYSILYEFVPEALGQGKDVEVGQLLEEAIDQHTQAVVDQNTDAGRAFLSARAHHLRAGYETVLSIYSKAGRNDLVAKVLAHSDTNNSKSDHL